MKIKFLKFLMTLIQKFVLKKKLTMYQLATDRTDKTIY